MNPCMAVLFVPLVFGGMTSGGSPRPHLGQNPEGAQRTEPDKTTIQALKRAAGIADAEGVSVEVIDAKTFLARSEILLVSAEGNGHCLTIHVLRKVANTYIEIWSASESPQGAGFCQMSPDVPTACARAPDRIVVRIPVFDYPNCRILPDIVFEYKHHGKVIRYTDGSRRNRRRESGSIAHHRANNRTSQLNRRPTASSRTDISMTRMAT